MKLNEISEADHPLIVHLIKTKLEKGEKVTFHSEEGTTGEIKSLEFSVQKVGKTAPFLLTDGFDMYYFDTAFRSSTPDYTRIRMSELADAKLIKKDYGWHVELPNHEDAELEMLKQLRKKK